MRREKVSVSAGAALLLSALYLLLGWDMLLIIALPAAAHELGHVLALRAQGAKIRRIRAEMTGLCMTYTGDLSPAGQWCAAFAGPAAGALYALAASFLGGRLGSTVLEKSAGVSIIFTAFNLLPAMPLDGGRMLISLLQAFPSKAEAALEITGLASGIALLLGGLYMVCRGWGMALEIAGIWLLLSQTGIVKQPGVL